jgi:signal peptidase II
MKHIAKASFRNPAEAAHPIIDVIYHENSGLIANLPVPLPVIFLIVGAAILFVLKKMSESIRSGNTLQTIALGMVLGGAVGNLIDRVLVGHVIDWILLGGRSVINIADLSIAIGALIYLLAPSRDVLDAPPDPS